MTDGVLGAAVRAWPTASAVLVGATAVVLGVHFFATRARTTHGGDPSMRRLARLSWLATLACVLVLGGTAFATVWLHGAMHGWALLAHVMAGGTLTAALAAFALTAARSYRHGARPGARRLARVTFWSVLVFGLLTTTSMLASTFPLFGTRGLERLLDVHRWAGLGLFVATALHATAARSRRA